MSLKVWKDLKLFVSDKQAASWSQIMMYSTVRQIKENYSLQSYKFLKSAQNVNQYLLDSIFLMIHSIFHVESNAWQPEMV